MIEETTPAIAELSAEQQLILSTELWNRNAEPILKTDADESILEFLKKSRESYQKDPDAVISHEDLKKKYKDESG